MKEFEIFELGSSMRAAKEYLTVIDRCQTVDEIDVFIENAKRQNRDDVIALAYQRRAILSSQTAVAEGRRPHLNYLEMGLKVDDVLIHAKIPGSLRQCTDSTQAHNYLHRVINIFRKFEELDPLDGAATATCSN